MIWGMVGDDWEGRWWGMMGGEWYVMIGGKQ